MPVVYTTRVVAGRVTPAAPLTSPAVPADRRWVLRDLLASNVGAASTVLVLNGPGARLLAQAIEPGTTYHLSFRQALNTGESFQAISTAADLDLVVTAYQLIDSTPP